MMTGLLLAVAVLGVLGGVERKAGPRPVGVADYRMSSGEVSVGFSREMGGAIVFLAGRDGRNLVNIHDPGRLIQQSYYAGQKLDRPQHHSVWKVWQWNPIQGGDAFNRTPGCSAFEMREGRFFSETTGLNWPADNERLRSSIRQWTSFHSPTVVRVDCAFVADREEGDEWGKPKPAHQELPACYFVADLTRLVTWREGKLAEFAHKQWNYAEPTPERWAACVDEQGNGVGVYSRLGERMNIGKAGTGKGGPEAAATMHVAPIITKSFGNKEEFKYSYYLIVGSIEEIRATAKRLYDEGK